MVITGVAEFFGTWFRERAPNLGRANSTCSAVLVFQGYFHLWEEKNPKPSSQLSKTQLCSAWELKALSSWSSWSLGTPVPGDCFGVVRDENSFCQMPPLCNYRKKSIRGEMHQKLLCKKIESDRWSKLGTYGFCQTTGKKYIRSCCGKVGVTSVGVTSEGKEAAECFKTYHFFFDNDLQKSGGENTWSSTFATSQGALAPGKTDGTRVSPEMRVIPLLPDLRGVQNRWCKSPSENKPLINNISVLKDQAGEGARLLPPRNLAGRAGEAPGEITLAPLPAMQASIIRSNQA